MKQFRLGLIVGLIALLISTSAFAAGSCTQTPAEYPSSAATLLTVACTGDASDGTVPNQTISGYNRFYLYQVEYDAGSTGPTDGADLVLNSSLGYDTLSGAGTNFIDNTTSGILKSSDLGLPLIYGDLTQVISNTSVNNATFTLRYTFYKVD